METFGAKSFNGVLIRGPRLTGGDQSEYLAADIAVDCWTRSTSVTSDVHARNSPAANVRMMMVRVRLRDIGASLLEGESSDRAASRWISAVLSLSLPPASPRAA